MKHNIGMIKIYHVTSNEQYGVIKINHETSQKYEDDEMCTMEQLKEYRNDNKKNTIEHLINTITTIQIHHRTCHMKAIQSTPLNIS